MGLQKMKKELEILNSKLSEAHKLLVQLEYSCCENCDKWFRPHDLRETIDDDVCCEPCCEQRESRL